MIREKYEGRGVHGLQGCRQLFCKGWWGVAPSAGQCPGFMFKVK